MRVDAVRPSEDGEQIAAAARSLEDEFDQGATMDLLVTLGVQPVSGRKRRDRAAAWA